MSLSSSCRCYALWAIPAIAQQQVAAEFQVPLKIDAMVQSFDCSNNPGPRIEFDGEILFTAGASVQFIFRNQREDGAPHETTETVTTTAQVVAPGADITLVPPASRSGSRSSRS